ncbi:MAG: TlpA family protein disulfide reductase [Planctomycetaceae bacterium]|jgi:thiol-disulfide isomerase/thioredoxin|nr:TlpA family protein disulfide reductase [Planctomycetaceae bacterium]
MYRNVKNWGLFGLSVLVGLLFVLQSSFLVADENSNTQNATEQVDGQVDGKKTPKLVSSFKEAKNVDEVWQYFMSENNRLRKSIEKSTKPEIETNIKLLELYLTAGERTLELATNDSEIQRGVYQKIDALKFLADTDVKRKDDHISHLNKFLDELEKDEKYKGKFTRDINNERFRLYASAAKAKFDENPTPENLNAIVSELKKWSNVDNLGQGQESPILVAAFIANTDSVQKVDADLGNKTVDDLITFIKSGENKIPDNKKQDTILQINGYRQRAIGAKPDLPGKKIDGSEFDWELLRGKYVLVNFTASWCVPCKQELPGLFEAYKKYKSQGLEIVSVYVMDELERSKKSAEEDKIPWLILSENLSVSAKLPAQSKAFAVSAIPTILLFDKSGKIIENKLLGKELHDKLTEIFGKP